MESSHNDVLHNKEYKPVIMSWGSTSSCTSSVLAQNSTCIAAKRSTSLFAAKVLKNNLNQVCCILGCDTL
jgi:hypothetical protein